MGEKPVDRLRALEERLWKEFRVDAVFPPGIPAAIRLEILERVSADLTAARSAPAAVELLALRPDLRTTLHFCTCLCRGCGLRHWCEIAGTHPRFSTVVGSGGVTMKWRRTDGDLADVFGVILDEEKHHSEGNHGERSV